MSIASEDLHKAIASLWSSSGLDATFKALWDSGVAESEWLSLNDQEAYPKQPFPYCVFEQSPGSTTDRMSGGTDSLQEIRDIPWDFRVHARAIDGDSRTAKEIAADLNEEIMKVFGGHPTESPTDLILDNGNFLIAQYQNDYGVRTGDSEYMWIVSYVFRLDVPVAV